MSLRGEGTISFWLDADEPTWQTNDNGYKFGPFSAHGIDVLALKNPNRTLSVYVSGPLDQTVTFVGPLPDILRADGIHIVVTWRHPVITLYVQGKPVNEMILRSTDRSTLPIRITSPADTPPMDVVGNVVEELSHVFNTISGFLDSSTPEMCIATVENFLDRSKFSIASSRTGSWEAVLNGTKQVFGFVKQRFGDFLAVCSGYGDRLAKAHVSQKEAEAEIATQKANQEKLNTIARATEVAREMSQDLMKSQTNLSEEDRQRLIDVHFISPMKRLASTIVQNELSVELNTSRTDDVA